MLSETVITKNKNGKPEARKLVSYGRFVIYGYINPGTLENSSDKQRIFMKTEDGAILSYFIIPIKGKRMLMIEVENNPDKQIWDSSNQKPVELEKLLERKL